ncbi:N-acetylneuraminate synthase family protein [Silvimonas sp.]|uniref:N-acetylneuraminate synthase family protein n=1 Tax=Silvimonas sp. TaxID=2650811 RepID=UPI00284FFF53|nr:N-acetylneuraminate synthase family protein [Silvimonas sp.]MDR3430273.1 N-acetylneuraminate synthase family protein [Silvimonas sp.]
MTDIFNDLFVLELANNHWGKVERGLKIIDDFAAVVKENGVRASIKLQFRDVDQFIHPNYRDLPDFRYIKKTRDTHMSWDNLRRLVDRVADHEMLTMVTPFDEVSVDKCVEFGVDILKIASSDIRDKTLLRKLAATGRPVIASSGGADLHHIDNLVTFFADRHIPFALNHCVSLYPSEDSDLELNQIDFLKARYPGIVIGFSTHEHRDWKNSVMMAYAKGARTFERHIDIDYEGVPVSSYCTLPEQADVWFKAFIKAKEVCGGPASVRRVVPVKEREYLDALVRGVYVRHDLPAGHMLTDSDVILAVPLLKGQISTREFESGEVLKTSLRAYDAINLADIDAAYVNDPEVLALVPDRGLEPRSADQPAVHA